VIAIEKSLFLDKRNYFESQIIDCLSWMLPRLQDIQSVLRFVLKVFCAHNSVKILDIDILPISVCLVDFCLYNNLVHQFESNL